MSSFQDPTLLEEVEIVTEVAGDVQKNTEVEWLNPSSQGEATLSWLTDYDEVV